MDSVSSLLLYQLITPKGFVVTFVRPQPSLANISLHLILSTFDLL